MQTVDETGTGLIHPSGRRLIVPRSVCWVISALNVREPLHAGGVDLRDTVLEESAMHLRQADFRSIWVISGPSDCNGFSLCQLEREVH
jgi:hypothetical protein